MSNEEGAKNKRAVSLLLEDEDNLYDINNSNGSSSSSSSSSIIRDQQLPSENVGIDRLSNLTFPLLVTILSFLPIQSVAAISTLSRQWRKLSTQITSIYIRFPHPTDSFDQSHIATVGKIMRNLASPEVPVIRTFDLDLSLDMPCLPASRYCFVRWLQQICGPNLEVVKVNLDGIDNILPKYYDIPICVFQSLSLAELHLHGNFHFGFEYYDPNTFALPKLKELALDLSDDQDIASSAPLFASCPLLEDLTLTLYVKKDLHFRHGDDDHIEVSLPIPNLYFLRLHVMAPKVEDPCNIVIDAPNLQVCHVMGDLAFYDFVTIPTDLIFARISITKTSFKDDRDYITKISGLIRGISCVKCLMLEKSGLHVLHSICHMVGPLPSFHKLYSLRFHINPRWVGELPGSFFFGNLKRVHILDVRCRDVEINLIQHILTNATKLEKLLVYVHRRYSRYDEDRRKRERDFCRDLFRLPKSSVTCHIDFSGTADFASSEDFSNGDVTFHSEDDSGSDSDSDESSVETDDDSDESSVETNDSD